MTCPASPWRSSGEERRGDRDGRVDPSVRVAVRHVDVAGTAVLGVAGHRGEPRERRDERTVAGVEAPRTVLPEGGDEGHGEVRVHGEEVVGTEPHALEDPGAEVGDEDVAPTREAPYQGAALRLREVDPDALLVLPEVVEVAVAVRSGGKPARMDRCAAGEVEPPRRLDLEHLRPERPEDHGAVRPGPYPGEIENPYPPEGAAAGRAVPALPARGSTRAGARVREPGGGARLPERGGRPGEPPPAATEAVRRPGQLDTPRPGVVHGDEELPRPEVLLLREPRMVEHRRRADPDLLQRVEHLLGGSRARPGRDPVPDLGRVRAPFVAGREHLARPPVRCPDERCHPLPLGLLGADDEHLAVAARVEAHRLVDGTVAPVVDAPRVLEGGEVPAEEECDRLLHRHVEVIAEPGHPRVPTGGERGDGRVETGLDERVVPEGADRRPLPRRAPAGDDVAPTAGVHQGELVSSPAAARAGEAERSDGDHHEPGVAFAPGLHVLELRGTPLPDHDVRPPEQPRELRPAGSRRPVEDDASLVGVEVEKGPAGRGAAARNDTPAAHRIALRRLDLDHLRAEVRERLAGARSRESAPDLDDRQAFEPLPHCRPLPVHEGTIIAAGRGRSGPALQEAGGRWPGCPPRPDFAPRKRREGRGERRAPGRGTAEPRRAWHT